MKIGNTVLVPNWISFHKKSDAICAAIADKIDEKFIEEMDGIYPNSYDQDCDDWQDEREYIIQDIFTLDDVTIVQISSNNKLLWVWKYESLEQNWSDDDEVEFSTRERDFYNDQLST